MLLVSFPLLAVVIAVSAQKNQTANLLLPASQGQNLYASVISANASAVAYKIECSFKGDVFSATSKTSAKSTAKASAKDEKTPPPEQPKARKNKRQDGSHTECAFPTPITITQGPSTLHFDYYLGRATQIVDCDLSSSANKLAQAVCEGTATGKGVKSGGTSTATLSGSVLPTAVKVPITAGQEKLRSTSSSTSKSSTSSENTTTPITSSEAQDATGASTTSQAPPATTSGASMMTQPMTRKMIACIAGIFAIFLLL